MRSYFSDWAVMLVVTSLHILLIWFMVVEVCLAKVGIGTEWLLIANLWFYLGCLWVDVFEKGCDGLIF